jgi:hypothetical protein
MNDISAKFDHLFQVISSDPFLRMESLGGEIPFFISTYLPAQEPEVTAAIKGLGKKLEARGIPALEINLYDLVMETLDQQLGPAEIFEIERSMNDKPEFKSALQSVLDINEVLMPAMSAKIKASGAKVYFLTGIGLVYPFIRSHNVLNNLQNIAKEAPTVLFFPGSYTGLSLELFGLLKDDNYYRAFNIDNYKL